MKKLLLFAAVVATATVSCKKTDDPAVTPTPVVPVVQENVGGEVSGVWEKGSTYKITNHIQISEGKSLTILEGATVVFSDSTVKPEFIVKGNLYVLGTDQNPVKFTVPDAWKIARNEFGNLWGRHHRQPEIGRIGAEKRHPGIRRGGYYREFAVGESRAL